MPSNKLNKIPNQNKHTQNPSGKATNPSGKTTTPRDSKDSSSKWYSCNYLYHILLDCPTREKYFKESKDKKDAEKTTARNNIFIWPM
jgi:hypothetical protein